MDKIGESGGKPVAEIARSGFMKSPQAVCPSCHSALRHEEKFAVCAKCSREYLITDGVLDLRLDQERSSNDRNQEKIWDGASIGSPSIPVDGFVCRNDFKSILYRRTIDKIGWPGEGSWTIDLGCFDGALSRNWTFRYMTSICGVDQSEGAIRRAVRVDPFKNQYYLAGLEHLPFADCSFDAALSLDVLEHVNHPGLIIRELARVLKPGAPFFFYVVSSRALLTWDWWVYYTRRILGLSTAARFGDCPGGGHDADKLVNPNDLRILLQDAGFEVKGLHPFHAFFTALYDDEIRRRIIALRTRLKIAESPTDVAVKKTDTSHAILYPEQISVTKRKRLKLIEKAFLIAQLLDMPWTLLGLGRGFVVWGNRRHEADHDTRART